MSLFLFRNYFLINIIYIALAGVVFPYKSPVSYLIPGGYAILALFWNFRIVEKPGLFFSLYLYSIYVFVLLFFSSDFINSLRIYFKVFTSLWLFPVSYVLLNTIDEFKVILKKTVPFLVLYFINFIVMNLLGIGLKGYGTVVNTGNLFTEGLNTISYLVIVAPLYLYFFRNEATKYLTMITMALITQILTLKRISIIGTVLGIVIYTLSVKKRSKYLTSLVYIFLLFSISYPLFSSVLEQQLRLRERRLDTENLDEEARYLEFEAINDKIFSFRNVSVSLFGEEVFNSEGVYGDYSIFARRQIHNDFSRLLHDTGILGLLFYLFVQYKIYNLYSLVSANAKKFDDQLRAILRGVFLSVFFIGFIFMFSGGIDGTLFQAFRYVVLGGIIGLLSTKGKLNG